MRATLYMAQEVGAGLGQCPVLFRAVQTQQGAGNVKVDFWQISSDPVERVVALIAQRVLGSGERMMVVSSDADQLDLIGKTLWETDPEAFLANGKAGEAGAARQPILLAQQCSFENGADSAAENGASHVIFADGEWRAEASEFARSFLLFGENTLEAARACWRSLDGTDDLERSFFRQDGGKWVKVA